MLDRIAWGALIDEARAGRLQHVYAASFPEQVAGIMGGRGLVFVATPYALEVVGPDGFWRFDRSLMLARRAALTSDALRVAGMSSIAPVALVHGMIEASGRFEAIGHVGATDFVPRVNPMDAIAWRRFAAPILAAADAVVVPDLSGWQVSAGVRAAVIAASAAGKPVFLYAGAAK